MANSIEKVIIPKVLGKRVMSLKNDNWEESLENELDDMVRTFLGFPKRYPEEYRDKQFARHLLWRIIDQRSRFVILFLKKADPKELSRFWIRLMPYIDGRFPEEVPQTDLKLAIFTGGMYKIIKDLVMNDTGSSFEEQMNRVVRAIRLIRAM